MIRALAICALGLLLSACGVESLPKPAGSSETIELTGLKAEGLPAQTMTIWLPPEYSTDTKKRFPVLYMWDGQNLFDPTKTHYGKAWMAQDVLTDLVAKGEAEPHIIVGIHSPPGLDRYRVYVPQFAQLASGAVAQNIAEMAGGPIASKLQLDWVADELVPRIDRDYRTLEAPGSRTIAGASMGGVMSCYAIVARPDTFGRAGCVSAHFALVAPDVASANEALIARLWDTYLDANLGAPVGRRVWMDHGTEMLDSYYAPWQVFVAEDFKRLGWVEGTDFTARVYQGAEHDENFWRERMPEMLRWLWREE